LRSKLIIRILILLLVAGTLYPTATILPRVHALAFTGTVCLTDPSFNTNGRCPTSVQAFTGPNATSARAQLRVAVNINSSDPLNGFEITVKADHTILQPAGVDVTGSLMPSASIFLAECIGGRLIKGSICSPTDTIDTIHLALTASGFLSTAPTTGNLFTAIFNIVGNSTSPSIVNFQTGCTAPATSHPTDCVTIENGTTTAVAENILSATYTTSTTGVPYISLTSNKPSIQFLAGIAGTRQAVISLKENPTSNPFNCGGINCVDISVTGPSALPPVSISPPQITDAGASTLTVSITKFTLGGKYYVTVFGSPDTTNTPGNGFAYLGAYVNITVYVSDFSISANPTTLTLIPGNAGSATVTVASVNGFTGNVTLTTAIAGTGTPLPTATLSLSRLLVKLGNTNSSTLTVNLPTTSISGTFTITVTGNFTTLIHTSVVTVMPSVPNISIVSVTISTTSATLGDTITVSVKLNNTGSTTGNFLLTVRWGTYPIGGPNNVTLTAGATQAFNYTWNTSGSKTGSDVVIATVSGGNVPSAVTSTPQTVALAAPAPSFFSGSLVYIVIGIIIAAIVAIAIALLMRRRSKSTTI